jgi:hypothetical protein
MTNFRQSYGIELLDLIDRLVTIRAQSIEPSRQWKITSLLRANIQIVIVVTEALDAAEQTMCPGSSLERLQLVAHLAVARVWKGLCRYSPRFGRRATVTRKARRVTLGRLHVFRIFARLLDLLVTVSTARAFARFELRTVGRACHRCDAKIIRQHFSMSLVREGVVKIAYLRPRKHAWAKRLVSLRNAPCFMADSAEAAWLTERSFEKLSSEIVTSDASIVWKVFGHRLVRVSGLLLGCQMTISTLDLYVFLLIVGKTTVAGSVLGLLD